MDPTQPATTRTNQGPSTRATLAPVTRSRSSREPSMMIYAAILGQSPRIDPTLSSDQSRLELSLHVDYSLRTMPPGLPGLRPTLRERVEHWAARAADKLQQARLRVEASRPRGQSSEDRRMRSPVRPEASRPHGADRPKPAPSIHLVGTPRRATADAA